MPSAAEARRLFWGLGAGVVLLDVVTKLAVERAFTPATVLPVAGDWVQLRLVYNPGAAFSLHLGPWSRWIFLVFAVVACVVLWRLSRQSPASDILRQFSCGLVAGGAFGNLVDRIRSPLGVVDFLDVGIGTARWPTFNVADIGVSCGAVLLAISFWLEDNRRERDAAAPPAA